MAELPLGLLVGGQSDGPAPPGANGSAWGVAQCSSADNSCVCPARRWGTAQAFANLCKHHQEQVRLLVAVELHLDKTEFQEQLKPCNNSVAPLSPGSVSERDAEMRAGVEAVELYLEQHHNGSWQPTLNNHASTRLKVDGVALVHSVSKCETFAHNELGSASCPALL